MLKCQLNSYLREFTTKFKEYIEDEFLVSVAPGTQKTMKSRGLVLEDTILFPEGGGQPCDHGLLRIVQEEAGDLQLEVRHVFRWKGKVVHLVPDTCDYPFHELPAGTSVHQTVQWDRREYHMTQHSGQHLVSALADKMFNWETLSWYLGPEHCYVDLDVESMPEDCYKVLEAEVNSSIRKARAVTAHVYAPGDPLLNNAKTRGLPEGYTGDVRVIVIEETDRNMCCGTHVSNLNQLGVIKFLKTEKKVCKKKKSCLLYFLVGEKYVFRRFEEMQHREESMSLELNKMPPQHLETVVGLKKSLKTALKQLKVLREESVMTQINAFKALDPIPSLFSLHRSDGDLELLNFVVRQFKNMNDMTLFLTIGEAEEGTMMLVGTKELVADVGPKICSCLSGKGQVSGNRFQARVTGLGARKSAQEILQQALDSSSRTIAA